MKKTCEMVKAEVENLIETEWHRIVPAYRNSCYELGIAIKVKMEGNNEQVEIETKLSYYPLPKMEVKGDKVRVDERQMPLKGIG